MIVLDQLTLVIPAKNEKESLPTVLDELKNFKLNLIIVLEKSDLETINSIKNFNCKIIYQKKNGYGNALIEGINAVTTKYFCIFNADGSFDPNELIKMYDLISHDYFQLIFATRYEKNCSSEDDTLVTKFGNYFFSKLGMFLFDLKISDILYTFVMGSTEIYKKLDIRFKDFTFCVELPIKANKKKILMTTSSSNERARIGGKKKVNAIKDGFLILLAMLKLFFFKNY